MAELKNPDLSAEEFVRMLLWDDFAECCGRPVVGAEYMGQQEMICCGEPEGQPLSDAQIVAALRERFTFCSYCGGNDETPPDHCMDCSRPRGVAPNGHPSTRPSSVEGGEASCAGQFCDCGAGCLKPAAAGVALPFPTPTDEQLRSFADALGMWVEPHEAARESGVPVELDIPPEEAARHNAVTIATFREAWANAFGVTGSAPAEFKLVGKADFHMSAEMDVVIGDELYIRALGVGGNDGR